MSDYYPIDEVTAVVRESIDEYWEARTGNPVIEEAHKVNLGELTAKFHVSIDSDDLDKAITAVNTGGNLEPPIQRLGSITLKDDTGETHYTTAKGANKVRVNYALRKIALQKVFPNYPKV